MSILQDRARVISGSLPRNGRTIVISDIHADRVLLDRLLEQAEYRPGEDLLILLGDFLLKGKENLATLHRIMELAALPNVVVLRGNCDDILEIIARNYPSGGMENFLRRSGFCREVWARAGMESWEDLSADVLLQRLDDTIPRELAFLHGLADIFVTDGFVFVHGGIYDGRQTQFEALDSFDCRKCDRFLQKGFSFDRYIVTGHWPVTSYPQPLADHKPLTDHRRRIISIDGGCSVQRGGQLNALIIRQADPFCLDTLFADHLPRVRALDAQARAGGSKRLYWERDEAEVLETRGSLRLIRQAATGDVLLCPEVLLWQDSKGRTHTGDLSDLALEVAPGDCLQVMARGDGWLYGKKNGLEGWYYGPVTEITSQRKTQHETGAKDGTEKN